MRRNDVNPIIKATNTTSVARTGRRHARENAKEDPERVLEAALGPTMVVSDDDLDQKHASLLAQRSRKEMDELESTLPGSPGDGDEPNRAKIPPFAFLLLASGCAVTDFAGSELTLYYGGTPARQIAFAAASFTAGALILTSGAAIAAEHAWKHGVLGRIGAVAIALAYVALTLVIASARFAPVEGDEISTVEIIGGALIALLCVGGPALGAHLALRAWIKARPAAVAEKERARSYGRAGRDLDRARRTLAARQRESREREAERQRLRSVYLVAYREEAARLERNRKSATDSNKE
jgi:hypothetical protein